jgi:SpoVK/Ycf46/Vps4 family AAA+-type ATPase
VCDETLRDLTDLERRCRHREHLGETNCGVRALFRGPSGTGKTLSARLLASVLQKDLYRLDLSAVVNKYIGETEKNLERVLSRAEELDVILLVDEGDALLTQRTSVQSSNDRYANLETNYLLQRLERFDGILIVTTNGGDRIDAAFERRMDVVVDFLQPQPSERWDIWQMHLPSRHAVEADFLNDVAARCALGGGQIRNAVLHASLLALDAGRPVDTAMIDTAVRREYRKLGAVCPLRPTYSVIGA